MNILLITTMYPGYEEESVISVPYVVHYISREWVKSGHEVTVMRLWPHYAKCFSLFSSARTKQKYANLYSFNIDGVTVHRIPIKKIPRINYTKKEELLVESQIIDLIDEYSKPDIIICDIIYPSAFIASSIKNHFHCELVVSLHNTDIFFLQKPDNFRRYLSIAPNIDKTIIHSEKNLKAYEQLFCKVSFPSEVIAVPFGIDKNNYLEYSLVLKKTDSVPQIITIACNLTKNKNVDVLINAFLSIRQEKDSIILKIIGEGPELNTLKSLAMNSRYSESIHFLGFLPREEVINEFRKSHIFAMISSPETFGLVYIEAMANACIVIGSKNEGIDGVIVDNQNGFLCEPKNVSELRYKLQHIIDLPSKERKRLILQSYNDSLNFRNDKIADRYLSFISE